MATFIKCERPVEGRPWLNDHLTLKSRRIDLTGRTRVYVKLLEWEANGIQRGYRDFPSMDEAWEWIDKMQDEAAARGWSCRGPKR